MTSNETENYEALYEHIKEEIESASVAIRESKGNLSYLDLDFKTVIWHRLLFFKHIKLLLSLITVYTRV